MHNDDIYEYQEAFKKKVQDAFEYETYRMNQRIAHLEDENRRLRNRLKDLTPFEYLEREWI